MMKIEQLQHNDLNCNIFSVYDYKGFTIQELLCEFFKKINECVDLSNESLNLLNWLKGQGLREEVVNLLIQWLQDGTLSNVINEALFNDLNKFIDNTNKTKHLHEWFYPKEKYSCDWGHNDIPGLIDEKVQYEEFLNWSYNKYVEKFPSYVKRETLGKDQSNQYNVYKYIFEPEHYDKTILLISGVHGNEVSAIFGLKLFLDEVLYNSEDNPILDYIRNNVKLVVLPIVNPFGFVNQKRQNYNGVDINRNTSYLWEKYTTSASNIGKVYYKGSSPFSEKESQYIRTVCESIKNDKFIGSVDMHNIKSIEAERILYYPRFVDNLVGELAEVVERFDSETGENRTIFSTSTVPSLTNYITTTYNVNGCNPEWNNSAYGSNLNAFNMRKITEWFGNLIFAISKGNPKNKQIKLQPYVKNLVFNANPNLLTQDENRMSNLGYNVVNSSSETFNTMKVATYEKTINGQYKVNLSGFIKLKCVKDTHLKIQPTLYQRYAPEQNHTTVTENLLNVIELDLKANMDYLIPVNANLQTFYSNYNDGKSLRASEVVFNIRSYCNTSSSVYINAFNLNLEFIPTNRGLSVERLRTSEASEYVREFPLRLMEELDD